MPLAKQIADKKAQDTTPRVNPEIDAKINQFIQENPELYGYYQALPKELLIRKLMLGKMQRSETAQRRNKEVAEWVEQHPEIKAKVEERIRNVPEANRQRAFLNVARTEAMTQGMHSAHIQA